jgi:hypothetical protein
MQKQKHISSRKQGYRDQKPYQLGCALPPLQVYSSHAPSPEEQTDLQTVLHQQYMLIHIYLRLSMAMVISLRVLRID